MTTPLRPWEQSLGRQFLRGVTHTFNWWRKFGLKEGVRRIFQAKELLDGELKGRDEFGNLYYENLQKAPNKQRFVVYSGWPREVNASRIPPGWFGWMTYMSDETPNELPPVVGAYLKPHQQQRLSLYGFQGNYAPRRSWQREAEGQSGFGRSAAVDRVPEPTLHGPDLPEEHSTYVVWEKEVKSAQKQDNTSTQSRA